jgi:hypothetical protein
MPTQLPQTDVHALGRALQATVRHADEVREMLRSDGWTETAKYCARRCQQIEQNQVWMADPEGVDQRRPEMVMLLRSLLYYGLSRYEPSPQRAYEAAEQRRRDLGMQTLGPPSAAYGLGEIGPPAGRSGPKFNRS